MQLELLLKDKQQGFSLNKHLVNVNPRLLLLFQMFAHSPITKTFIDF